MLLLNPSSTKSTDSQTQSSAMGIDPSLDGFQHYSDHELEESIKSKLRTLETTAVKLPDKGEKLRATIDRFQEELARRKLRGPKKVSLFYSIFVVCSCESYPTKNN